MRYMRFPGRVSGILALAAALGATVLGQVNLPAESIGGPLTGPAVLGAPFSADATTTVHATLGDGTRLDQSTTDRYYRDSAGRVRVERPMSALPAPVTISERHIRTIIDPDPGDGGVYTLDAQTRTARSAPRSLVGMTAGGGREFSVPVGGVRFLGFRRAGDLLSADPDAFADVRDEPLGSQRIAGVETTGRRITLIVPAGYQGNTQPFEDDRRAMGISGIEPADSVLAFGFAKHDRVSAVEHPPHRAARAPLRNAAGLHGGLVTDDQGPVDVVHPGQEPARRCISSGTRAVKRLTER